MAGKKGPDIPKVKPPRGWGKWRPGDVPGDDPGDCPKQSVSDWFLLGLTAAIDGQKLPEHILSAETVGIR